MQKPVWDDQLIRWIQQYTGDLYRRAYYLTADKMLAEDLVQDTFIAAAEKKSAFEGRSSPKTWLMGILKNKIADHFRKSNRLQQAEKITESFFSTAEHWQQVHVPHVWLETDSGNLLDEPAFTTVLETCLHALPELWQSCVHLKFQAAKDSSEICHELALTASNYWQIMHRIKLSLRNCLEINWFKPNR